VEGRLRGLGERMTRLLEEVRGADVGDILPLEETKLCGRSGEAVVLGTLASWGGCKMVMRMSSHLVRAME
jgi:hypothetical protein